MPLTETDICNRALDRLGAAHITSLAGDQSTNAGRLRRSYPIARDAVIRAYAWNCCQRRASLAALGDAPEHGFARQFALPEDPYCLRVLQIDGEVEFALRYKIEGRAILTDEAAPLKLLFLARVDPSGFDALLSEALAARLAADLGFAVTGSASVADSMAKAYRDILVEARGTDAQEGSADDMVAADWLESRG